MILCVVVVVVGGGGRLMFNISNMCFILGSSLCTHTNGIPCVLHICDASPTIYIEFRLVLKCACLT